MHTISLFSLRARILVAITVVLMCGVFLHILNADNGTEMEVMSPIADSALLLLESSTTFGFPVSGIIEAKDFITVRSQTAGIVTHLVAVEGTSVITDELLLIQEVPLLRSRIGLQSEQNDLTALMQSTSLIARTGDAENARVALDAASTTYILTQTQTQTQIESNAALLATQIHGSVTGLVAALDFIDAHESFFSGKSLRVFRETVYALYGNNRTYLTGSVQYQIKDHTDILALLDTLTAEETYPESGTLIEVAELVDAELDAVRRVLVDGESDFLDVHVVSQDDSLYTTYLSYRGLVVEAQANLRALIASARIGETNVELSSHAAKTQDVLGRIGYTTAAQIAENAARTARKSTAVGDAALGVLLAEEALGMVHAPFAGVVGEVFVNEGEYVLPGTSLMTLGGEGARELRVTVPSTMLPYLKEGAPFSSHGIVLGYVSRFAPILTEGSISVFIELTDHEYIIGDILHGEIECEFTSGDTFVVPRVYVYFTSLGAFVRTESGVAVQVVIVHDTGKMLLVKPVTKITERISPVRGITF